MRGKALPKSAAIIAGALVVAVVVAAAAVRYYDDFRDSLYDELFFHLEETSSQITETIDTTMEAQWTQLEMLGFYLGRNADKTMQEILADMADMLDELGEGRLVLALVDETGRYNRTDGTSAKDFWLDTSYEDSAKRHTFIRQNNMVENKEQMVFLLELGEPVTLADGSVITHVVASCDMEVYNEISRSDAYSGQNMMFILNETGGKVYQDTQRDSFLNAQNVLKALDRVEVVKGSSAQELRDGMAAHEGRVAAIEHDGEEYFLAVQPMEHNGWGMLMVVPEKYVSAHTSDFASLILGSTSAFVFIVLAAAFAAAVVWLRMRNRARLLQLEKEGNEALAAALDDARRANQSKSQFLSHMSHDVRTPINGIIGMLGIAERNMDSPEVLRDCLRKIRTASNHLLSLINDILDMSKLESGKVELLHEPFFLGALLDGCCSIMQGQLAGREDVEFRTDFSQIQHECVLGSPLHLRQVLINILSNAVKYTEKGRISFTVRELAADGGEAEYEFVVADTGIGMSEEFLEHLFEPFAQEGGGARTTYEGTGLGMAIVKKTLDQMGGTIAVESALDEGSTFTVRLTFPVSLSAKPYAAESNDAEAKADVAGMRVLLVEDNELNTEVAKAILESEGVVVETAENGKEALEMFLASEPGAFEMILMDVMMPVMGGFEATGRIRESDHPQAQTIPIIAQTANAFAEDVAAAKAAGMDAHVAKPLNRLELLGLMAKYRKEGRR